MIQQHIEDRDNPSLWAVHSVEIDGRAAIEWYEIDAVTDSLLQNGTIQDPNLLSITHRLLSTILVKSRSGSAAEAPLHT